MIGMEWKKVLTDCGKYKNYWKFYTAYFLKFATLPKIRQQKIFFLFKVKAVFKQCIAKKYKFFACKPTNCATALVTLTTSKCT
jgi:hypothetical protein